MEAVREYMGTDKANEIGTRHQKGPFHMGQTQLYRQCVIIGPPVCLHLTGTRPDPPRQGNSQFVFGKLD